LHRRDQAATGSHIDAVPTRFVVEDLLYPRRECQRIAWLGVAKLVARASPQRGRRDRNWRLVRRARRLERRK
jgi:hypothetical protein